MKGVRRAERQRRVAQVAELLGISSLLERRPGELSGGEQQRVAMGRAIVREPKAFLFDEPLSNRDAALRAELRVELGRLLRRLGATALYVTHDQAEAMTLASRIAVLRAGKLEQLATPRRIYESPSSAFVGKFFGVPPMNLIDVERDGGHVRAGGFVLPCRVPGSGNVTLGIRPEHVRVAASTQDDEGAVAGRIAALELHGAETHVEVETERLSLRARLAGFDVPGVGEPVGVSLDASKALWFDTDTGRAL
jgi:ABC-type sugar transport system ATPase subunit